MSTRARSTDPETSHWAADAVNLRDNQREVLAALCGGGPRPHESLVAYMRNELRSLQTASGIRTRCHELVEAGHVQWSGRYAVTTTGQRTRVWECVHCANQPVRVPTTSGRVITRTPRPLPDPVSTAGTIKVKKRSGRASSEEARQAALAESRARRDAHRARKAERAASTGT